MVSLGVYGVVLGGWASNNRWSLLGGIRGSAQMISYEIAMGLALVAMVMTYGTLDLQEMARAQGASDRRLAAGLGHPLSAARLPDLPHAPASPRASASRSTCRRASRSWSAGYFTEYSGIKHLMFFMTDFVEVVVVAALGDDAVLRRLAGSVPDPRRLPLPWGRRTRAAAARWSSLLQVVVVHGQGALLLLGADPGALDAAALPLRPADAVRAGRACCRWRWLNVLVTGASSCWRCRRCA